MVQALCKQRDILLMLLATVRQSESGEVRLLGSQSLRKALKVHWRQVSKQVTQITACCLSAMFRTTESRLRSSQFALYLPLAVSP